MNSKCLIPKKFSFILIYINKIRFRFFKYTSCVRKWTYTYYACFVRRSMTKPKTKKKTMKLNYYTKLNETLSLFIYKEHAYRNKYTIVCCVLCVCIVVYGYIA